MSWTMRWDIGFPQKKSRMESHCGIQPQNAWHIKIYLLSDSCRGYFIPGEEAGTNKTKIITLAGGPCVSLVLAILYGIIHFCIPELVQSGNGLYEILLSASASLHMQYAVAGIVCLFLMLYGVQYSLTDQYR